MPTRNELHRRIEDLERALAQAREDAYTDELTRLPNRRKLAHELTARVGCSRPFAVVLFDLANLKAVNDGLGHDAGDALIRAAADAVRGDADLAARYGGDEFLVIVDGGLRAAEAVRARIEERFGYRETLPGRSAFLAGGCAVWTGGDPESVVHEASVEMKRRKETTKRERGELACRAN